MGKTTSSKKRKRQESKATSSTESTTHSHNTAVKTKSTTSPVAKKKKTSQPLKGLILAVSTLDVKGQKHATSDSSYQAVSALCKELGANVSMIHCEILQSSNTIIRIVWCTCFYSFPSQKIQ